MRKNLGARSFVLSTIYMASWCILNASEPLSSIDKVSNGDVHQIYRISARQEKTLAIAVPECPTLTKIQEELEIGCVVKLPNVNEIIGENSVFICFCGNEKYIFFVTKDKGKWFSDGSQSNKYKGGDSFILETKHVVYPNGCPGKKVFTTSQQENLKTVKL